VGPRAGLYAAAKRKKKLKSHMYSCAPPPHLLSWVSCDQDDRLLDLPCSVCDCRSSLCNPRHLLNVPVFAAETSGLDPDEAPVEDVEQDEASRKKHATAAVDPLRDLLGCHRSETGVIRGGAGCGDGNHHVRVARVILRTHVRVCADRIHGVDSQSVTVILKQHLAMLLSF